MGIPAAVLRVVAVGGGYIRIGVMVAFPKHSRPGQRQEDSLQLGPVVPRLIGGRQLSWYTAASSQACGADTGNGTADGTAAFSSRAESSSALVASVNLNRMD